MITRVCALSLLLLFARSGGVNSYSQVAIAGSGPGHEDGPKVYKALNMDLIYPKTFNSSENIISTTETSPQKPLTETVESLSATADEQFTPERSSSEVSSALQQPPPPATAAAASSSSSPAVAVVTAEQPIPVDHYTSPPFFVTPDNHASDESKESEVTSQPSATATGRAVDYRPAYPFSQLLTPNGKGYRPSAEPYPVRSRPISRPNNSAAVRRVVYPSYQASRTPSRAEIDKLSGKGYFSDRFTPSEAVASATFKQKANRKPSISRPIGQPSNKVSSFVSPKDLYSFPPNINTRYPSPTDMRQASPSDTVSSYLPPAAGPAEVPKLVGPVNPDLLPKPSGGESKDMAGDGYHYDPPPMPKDIAQTGYLYEPPKAPLDTHLDTSVPDQPEPAKDSGGGMMDMDSMDHLDTAPPADDGGMIGTMDDGAPPADHDHDHHDFPHDMEHDIGGYVDGKEYPTPPPGYMAEHDDHHDHDHHHPDIDFAHGPYFHDHHHDYDHHHYPDIVYDDYHDHHHFHHDHPTMPPMTTEAPPPPPPPAPEMPRVKKYSYFYIGRKLWYIPLYFTVWFTFYVLWLILKSIARHKTNLPNHYVSRRSIEELNHREAREAIDKLTVKVMDGIEKFKERFIG